LRNTLKSFDVQVKTTSSDTTYVDTWEVWKSDFTTI